MTILWVMDAFERMNEPQSRKEGSMVHDPGSTVGELVARMEALEQTVKQQQEELDDLGRLLWEHGHYSDDSGVHGPR